MIARWMCWLFGHAAPRADWFFSCGGAPYRRPVFVEWCGRCHQTLRVRRSKRSRACRL